MTYEVCCFLCSSAARRDTRERRGIDTDNIPLFAAGVFLAALPMLVTYLFFQRQITDGVTAGATKG